MLGNVFHRRQIWALPTPSTSSIQHHCTPFTLPSKGVLTIDQSSIITLSQNAVFAPECTGGAEGSYHAKPGDPSSVADLKEPFYASTSPTIYAIAAATVVSYLLVVMLFITPRTFAVGGPGGGSGFLSRRGLISGSYGSNSIVGVGRRPWLQKVAALTVAISLTIATTDTFRVAKRQYEVGYVDTHALTDEVVGGLEIRIVRIISNTFLWLAQVQTLIRLFPRHKEKVIIKWTGFALIILDTIFSILNSFVDTSSRTRPRSFVDAVPALSYLFELSLSLLYAAWVIYYSLCKRRFAFFHTKMRNICLVALLSLSAVLVPVVFFVLDISKPDVAGWGDYIRWVGAAAASVVVWEWVERIEALERDERKDGILGREVFDGDEMLEVTPSAEIDWPNHSRYRSGGPGGGDGGTSSGWDSANGIIHRPTRSRLPFYNRQNRGLHNWYSGSTNVASSSFPRRPDAAHPPVTTTPISRTDTASADSTIYAVRYHPVTGPSSAMEHMQAEGPKDLSEGLNSPSSSQSDSMSKDKDSPTNPVSDQSQKPKTQTEVLRWITDNNPFKRRRALPPPEVAIAQANDNSQSQASQTVGSSCAGRWDMKSKIESFAVSQRKKFKARSDGRLAETSLPVTVIPAQPRGQRTWSPQYFEDQRSPHGTAHSGNGDESQQNQSSTDTRPMGNSYYVPLPTQSTSQAEGRSSLVNHEDQGTRRPVAAFVDSDRRAVNPPPSRAIPPSQTYRYSRYTSTDLAPIVSVPSSELSISRHASQGPSSHEPVDGSAPQPEIERSDHQSIAASAVPASQRSPQSSTEVADPSSQQNSGVAVASESNSSRPATENANSEVMARNPSDQDGPSAPFEADLEPATPRESRSIDTIRRHQL